jgi:hypothetical protein
MNLINENFGGLIILLMILSMAGCQIEEARQETAQIANCVSAGGSWVRSSDAPYRMECHGKR